MTGSFRAKRAAHRAAQRSRANAAATSQAAAAADPWAALDEGASLGMAALFGAGAVLFHLGIAGLARFGPAPAAHEPYEQAVVMAMREPPPPPPVVSPPPVVDPPPPVPKLAPAAVVAPPPTATADVPPDPVAAEPPPEPAKPVRRVVGVSLESTTTGEGPAFAVGNTRMGSGPSVAADPNGVGRLAPESRPPRRIREEEPVYPPGLRAQNIEGEVGLDVEVARTGAVGTVRVLRPSPYDELNRAAVVSASHGGYEPAVVNGTPVAQHIQFTVRFRLRR